MLLGSPKILPKLSVPVIHIGDEQITPSSYAKNIGFVFDKHLNCQKQINDICKNSWYLLRNIMKIKGCLDRNSLERIIHAFVTSRVDMNNALLYGASDQLKQRLQLVLNAAARTVSGLRKFDHITPTLMSLHWLPVNMRIIFKILLFTFKALNGKAPSYISSMIHLKPTVRALRSNNINLLSVPKVNNASHGEVSFPRAAPTLWNALPKDIRMCQNITAFKKLLKTHLYKKAFN